MVSLGGDFWKQGVCIGSWEFWARVEQNEYLLMAIFTNLDGFLDGFLDEFLT